MPYQTPNDPRTHMRGPTFHTFVSAVVLTRGPVPAPYPYLVFDDGYQTLDVLADGVTPQAVAAIQVSVDGGALSVPGLWRVYGRGAVLVHYDGEDDAVAAVERVRDAGVWFWSIVALDDAPAPYVPTLCARVPRANTPRHLRHTSETVCWDWGRVGPCVRAATTTPICYVPDAPTWCAGGPGVCS